jgi:hypothetical protein
MGFVSVRAVLVQVFYERFGLPCQFSFHQLLNVSHLRVWFETGTMGLLRLKCQGALSQPTLIIINKLQHCVLLFFVFYFYLLDFNVTEHDDSWHTECPIPHAASQPDTMSVLPCVSQVGCRKYVLCLLTTATRLSSFSEQDPSSDSETWSADQ